MNIHETISPGGIKAWLAEDHTIPFTAMEIYFRGGSSLEDDSNLGAAYFLTGMLDEGAGDYKASEFQSRQQELAAEFAFDASQEYISVSVRFLTENMAESLELLRLALHEPRFDEDRLEFVRNQILATITRREKDTRDIASDAMRSQMFGSHPFSRPVEGTAETVQALTSGDLDAFRRSAVNRGDVVVAAAGDITPEQLGALLDILFAGLSNTAPEAVAAPDIRSEGGVSVIDFPSPQSFVLFRHEGFLRSDPDFLTAYVMNEILGSGLFESRLRDEVREKRGLTYGIGSYLQAYSSAGLISGQFSTENESVAEAVDVVRAVWGKMAAEGVSEEELDSVKTYLTGAYPLRFDGNGRIASILAGMQRDNMPLTYIDNRNDMVNAITVEEINRVAARLLKPEELYFVVVGQPVGLESSVEESGN